jgi:hypothetical protein
MLQQEQGGSRGPGIIAPLNTGAFSAAAPLNTLPAATQQVLLMRDLLSVLAGVEGQHIRVAAADPLGTVPTGTDGTGETGSQLRRMTSEAALAATLRAGPGAAVVVPKLSEAHFLIDLDTADRSVGNQVRLPC